MVKNRIGILRRELELNQRELGERLGVGQTTVSAWETGKNEPDSESLHKMSQLFHASIGYILGYEAEDSLHRGLSEEAYIAYQKKLQEDFERKHMEEESIDEAEKDSMYDLTEKEQAETIRSSEIKEWMQSGKADTIEGYLASRIIDSAPQKEREWLLTILQQVKNYPQ